MAARRPRERWARTLAAVLALTLTLASAPALALSPLHQRMLELREQSRLVPERVLDELLKLRPRMADETPSAQAELLAQISAAQRRQNQFDASLATADQLIAYGTSLRDDGVVAMGMLVKAEALNGRNDVQAARRLIFEAEKIALRGADPALLARAETAVGQAYDEDGDFLAALPKLRLAVDTARRIPDDSLPLFNALQALARLHAYTKQKEQAYAALAELWAVTEKQPSPARMMLFKSSEYTVANNFGDQERARRALLDSLEQQRKQGARQMLTFTLNNLADSYLQTRDYARAARYASETLQLARGDITLIGASAYLNLGHAYLGMGRIAEGKRYYQLGLEWFEKSGDKPQLQEALLEYGGALEQAGDTAGAVRAYHLERALSNELFEKQRRQGMLELQEKYTAEAKERRIELLSKENQAKGAELDNRRLQQRLWWALAAVFALAAVVVGLLYRKVRQANARLAVKNIKLKAQSTLDPLTSLYNRRHFQDHMRALGAGQEPDRRLPRRDDSIGALFLLDVDHFKHINDTHGHAVGDLVLKMVADSLRTALRGTDMIVRWGGEEFLAFVPASPRDGLDDIARRILTGISSQAIHHQEQAISVNVSVGFAPFPLAAGGTTLPWERVVNLIDMALYLAKSNGRNRAYGVRGFANAEHTSMEAIEQDLEQAWRDGFVELSVVRGAGDGR
ncbi:MAG TPA: diguanylate cyclase [Duganella sp.]|uniref:GGDEF domain-containing protein n=1 Tax=Duganella sp. TaxID=1904440 RepID=UPI002ED50F60